MSVQVTLTSPMPAGSGLTIKFPKLNPDAPTSQRRGMVITTPVCTSVSNVNPTLSCTFASDILTISNVANTLLASGSKISLTVSGVYNPINFSLNTLTVSSTYANGIIDTGTSSWLATTSTQIDQATVQVSATDKTVQELTTFSIDFVSPIPLSAGTKVTVVFPAEDFTFDQTELTQVQGFGLFGSLRNLQFTLDTSQRSIKIIDGLESYRQQGISGRLLITLIKNSLSTKPTGTFNIYITESNGEKLAVIQNGVTYTALPGSFNSVMSSMSSQEVNSFGDFTILIALDHSVSALQSTIEIQMPANMIIGDQIKVGYSSLTETSQRDLIFTKTGNKITLSQIFQTGFAKSFTLKIQNVQNPGSALEIKGLELNTYDNGYLVDKYLQADLVLYDMQPSLFYSYKADASSQVCYSTTSVTFEITLADSVPLNGLIQIQAPSDIQIFSSVSCQGLSGTLRIGSLQCTLSNSITGVQTLMITNAFTQVSPTKLETVKFQLTNLRMPLSTRTSGSFQIYTLTSQKKEINYQTSLLTLSMSKGAPISIMTASTNSNNVGDKNTTITLSFQIPVPFKSGDQVYIEIPQDLGSPDRKDLKCFSGGAPLMEGEIICEINSNIVTLNLQVASGSVAPANSRVTFKISKITNPQSVRPTQEFQVVVKEAEGYEMAYSLAGNGAKFRVGNPSIITDANITVMDQRQMALTTITISFITISTIPVGGELLFDFDAVYFKFPDDKSQVTCSTNLVQNVNCEFPRESQILVKNILPVMSLLPGNLLTFTVDNCLLEVDRKMTTESWQITTLTVDGYPIDRLTNGLTLSFPCNLPCLTCPDSNPSFCYSCNPFSNQPILYNTRCYSQCPDGLYLTEFNQCVKCDPKCKTCQSDNPKVCLTCEAKSDYPFLDGTTCAAECQPKFYANAKTNKCEACQSPCYTCENITRCTSCNDTAVFKYFVNNQCLKSCPASGYTELRNECIKCDQSKCKECQKGFQSQCISCQDGLILNTIDNTCAASCPVDISIYDLKTKTCKSCDENCNTCSKENTKYCNSCKKGLLLLKDEGICVAQCPKQNQIALNNECTSCSSQCETCIGKPDSCQTCSQNTYFYDYKCLKECPSKYEVMADTNQCVITGLRCPFGHAINKQGNGCILKAQICAEGKKLNLNKDRCIPEPGNYVPFPLIITFIVLSLTVLVSWFKKRETLITTNLIALLSFIESIGIFTQIVLSWQMGIYSTLGFTLISSLFLYGSNLFFCIIYIKQVSTDNAFKYWVKNYKGSQKLIICLGGTINFKLFRLIYGKLFGRKEFNAVFDDPATFFKPFTMISVFSIITTTMPILIANICAFVFLEMGYQLTMNCIEMTIIEIILLLLIIYEKFKIKGQVIKETSYFKVDPKLMQGTQSVFASNTTDNQEYLSLSTLNNTRITESTPYQEHFERRRNLEQLLQTMMYKQEQQMPAKQIKGGRIQNILNTSEQIKELQDIDIRNKEIRKCRSFIDLTNKSSDTEGEDEVVQNFISEPTSPREKEMLQNPKFFGNIIQFKKAMRQRDQFDNVYAESKPSHFFIRKKHSVAFKKTQTNILELLALDHSNREIKYQSFLASTLNKSFDSDTENNSNLPHDFTKSMISQVIGHISECDMKAQKISLPQNRVKMIPKFQYEDIKGQFHNEKGGLCLIMRNGARGETLIDKNGKRVNRRGYLIDIQGNIITSKNQIIFRPSELNSDQEIPEPYFSQNLNKMEQKYKIEDISYFRNRTKRSEILKSDGGSESYIQKNASPYRKNGLIQSDIESAGEHPAKYNSINKRGGISTIFDEDDSISQILQPMQIKTKEQLLGRNNLPRGFVSSTQNIARSRQQNFNYSMSSNPLKVSSIGIFDSQDGDEIMKELLANGGSQEDLALIRQIQNYEQAMKQHVFKDAKNASKLAKRNLAKVYGKAQQQNNRIGDQRNNILDNKNLTDISFKNFQESTTNKFFTNKPPVIPNIASDSRMRNLESIYLQQNRPSSQASMKQRTFYSTTNNYPSLSQESQPKFRPLMNAGSAMVDSDFESAQIMRTEVDKMNKILDKDRKKKGAKLLLNGGWI